jgi:hypothetical protein
MKHRILVEHLQDSFLQILRVRIEKSLPWVQESQDIEGLLVLVLLREPPVILL